MSMQVITIGLFLTFLFALLKKRKLSICFGSVAVLLITLIGNGALPRILLKNLSNNEYLQAPIWKKDNAIVILGGGTVKWSQHNFISLSAFTHSRVFEGARLYHTCKESKNKCTIFASGGDPLKNGITEAKVIRDNLVSIGVDPNDIKVEEASFNTYQNAQFTSELLHAGQYDQIVLASSGFHMQRSLLYFSQFGITPIPAPADYIAPRISLIPNAYNFAIFDFVLHEQIGVVRFYIYNYLGWNKGSSKPGAF